MQNQLGHSQKESAVQVCAHQQVSLPICAGAGVKKTRLPFQFILNQCMQLLGDVLRGSSASPCNWCCAHSVQQLHACLMVPHELHTLPVRSAQLVLIRRCAGVSFWKPSHWPTCTLCTMTDATGDTAAGGGHYGSGGVLAHAAAGRVRGCVGRWQQHARPAGARPRGRHRAALPTPRARAAWSAPC